MSPPTHLFISSSMTDVLMPYDKVVAGRPYTVKLLKLIAQECELIFDLFLSSDGRLLMLNGRPQQHTYHLCTPDGSVAVSRGQGPVGVHSPIARYCRLEPPVLHDQDLPADVYCRRHTCSRGCRCLRLDGGTKPETDERASYVDAQRKGSRDQRPRASSWYTVAWKSR